MSLDPSVAEPGLAFAAGLLTVAAPCVLPLLPVVVGATAAGGPGARPIFIAIGFALSFTVFALAFGSVQHLLGLEQQVVRDLAAVLLIGFGLTMVWPALFRRLGTALDTLAIGRVIEPISRLGDRAGPGWAGGLLVGVSLGAIWTPCAGPVLATILTLVAAQSDWRSATTLVSLYALGAALPMLAIAYGGQWILARVRALAGRTRRWQQALGVVVVAVGLLTLFQYDATVTVWLSRFYPAIAEGL